MIESEQSDPKRTSSHLPTYLYPNAHTSERDKGWSSRCIAGVGRHINNALHHDRSRCMSAYYSHAKLMMKRGAVVAVAYLGTL